MGMREDYQALMEKQLNEWKAQSERFKANAEQVQAHVKAQYENGLNVLQAKQAEAWENFHKLKGANEDAWARFKSHMDKASDEVKIAVEQITTKFK
jgi:ElaB/YqjD/DUF883 family membrane-anchored ribosome-binding protein